MATATAPGPRVAAGEGGGSAASALSMERIQSLTDLADLEAAYSRLCEEEVCGGPAREAVGRCEVRDAAPRSVFAAPAPSGPCCSDKESGCLVVTVPVVPILYTDVNCRLGPGGATVSPPWH